MFNDFCFLEEVTNFRKLGTGHKRTNVVAVDRKSHRILFLTSVFQNRPLTTGKVRFENKRTFDLCSRTVGNQEVSLFFWTEKLERRWLWQSEIEKIDRWLESARAEDVTALAEEVAQLSGLPKNKHNPMFACVAKLEIKKQLPELNIVQLQGLTAMLFSVTAKIAA